MATIFEQQLDYIIFFYGTAFFVLASACHIARKRGDDTLPWRWLFLFSVAHGLNEWLDLAYLNLGGGALLTVLRVSALTVSFIFLMEFGIAITLPRAAALKWLPVVLGVIPLLGISSGGAGVLSISRFTLGLAGGLWASAAFMSAARNKNNISLKAVAAIMMLYALETGLVVDAAPFFPASILNFETFFKATGIPIQFIKAVTIYAASVAILSFVQERTKVGQRQAPFHFVLPLAAFLFLVITGFTFTAYLGRNAEENAKKYLLTRTMSGAAAINPERVAKLTGTPADIGSPDYIRLKEQVQKIKGANPDCRYVYLMRLRGDKLIFLVDAEPAGSRNYTGPGYVYEDSTPAYVADFKAGRTTVYDVYEDSWGAWVTGSDYIRDDKGRVLAQFSMDVDAHSFGKVIREFRLFGILITFGALTAFLTVMLSFDSYLTWLRIRQTAEHEAALKVAMQQAAGEKKLRSITSALGEGVIVQDAEGGISFVNPEAERLLGWEEHEITGSSLRGVLKCRDMDKRPVPEDNTAAAITFSKGETIRSEKEYFTRKDGSVFPVSYVSSPIVEEETVTGIVLAFQDITERTKLERQSRDFLAMVSHDLKSPVTVIQGYTELLSKDKSSLLDTDSKTMVDSIRKSCAKLLSLLNDFLTISSSEAGALTLQQTPEDITALVAETCSSLSPIAKKKGIAIFTSLQEDIPHAIIDKVKLQRAIGNLISNAINYTPSGGSINVGTCISSVGDERFIVLSVTDTGPGIAEDEADMIFEKYYRSRRVSGVKGTGLGLAIVRAVAKAHGGSVTLESTESKGSTFKLSIPIKTTVSQ